MISVLVCTHGDEWWARVASTAASSAILAGAPDLIVYHDPAGTLAQARNAAARTATGEWLCFLDADDELDRGYLDAMRRSFPPAGELRLLVPAVQYVETTEGGAETRHQPRVLNTGRPLSVLNRAVIGTLVPRRLFFAVGGFRELPAWEDWDLFLRCERAGAELVDVPDAVYVAHRRRGSRNSLNARAAADLYRRIRGDLGIQQ